MNPTNEQPSVRFDEEQRMQDSDPETPKMIKWVMQYSGGLVKDEKQANYVLIGIAVCALLLTVFLVKSSFGSGSSQNVIPPLGEIPGPGRQP